jgi:adenylyltransferase/sulfurtransferase
VAETMRALLGRSAGGALLSLDLWSMESARVELGGAREDCPVCSQGRYDYLERRAGGIDTVLCGRDAVQIRPREERSVDLEALAERLSAAGEVRRNAYLLRFREREGIELVCFPDGRVLVLGTSDPAVARSLQARYVGS